MHDNDNHQDDARPIPHGDYKQDLEAYASIGNDGKWTLFLVLLGAGVSFGATVILTATTGLPKLQIMLISLACVLVVCIPITAMTRTFLRRKKRSELFKKYSGK